MFPEALVEQAARLVAEGGRRGIVVATVESCTGGLVAGLLTGVPGSSVLVDRGFVTYSNQAKTDLVAVPAALIEAHGAVSRPVAIAMAEGGLARSSAQLCVSITGIAGPGGGSQEKPVGTVHFALARQGRETEAIVRAYGEIGREQVRLAAVGDALTLLERAIIPLSEAG